MPGCILLFPYRTVGLLICSVRSIVAPNLPVSPFFFLPVKVGIDTPDIYEMSGKLKIFSFSCQPVHFHQSEFCLGMSRISAVAFRDKMLIYMIRQLLTYIKKLSLARSLVVSASRLKKMTGAVKLVCLQKIGPPFFSVLYGKISVKITVLILCPGDHIYKIICLLFKQVIFLGRKSICRGFYPFCSIAVLKNHTVKAVRRILPSQSSSGIYKICVYVAFLGIGQLIP